MKTRQFFASGVTVILLALTVGLTQAQAPQPQQITDPQATVSNAFTYQGQLTDSGNPANGQYGFQFILYNALTGGSQVGSIVTTDNVSVTNGLFTVALDFGSVFDGTGLWLEAAVRPGDSTGNYTTLSPRQELTPAPYALYAVNIPQHGHFEASWSGSATIGLQVLNTSGGQYSSAVKAAVASSGDTRAVIADNWSTSGVGVLAHAAAITGTNYGVYAYSDSTGGRGVLGHAAAITGSTRGGLFYADSNEGIGVAGHADAPTGTTKGVYGRASSPSGYGGYFENWGGGKALYANGDVAQSVGGDGLVKAAVFANCAKNASSIHRFFNAVNDSVTIFGLPTWATGYCSLDFDFDLSNRFWLATFYSDSEFGGDVLCRWSSSTPDTLFCSREDRDGISQNGDIMVLVY
jgi:hypothetical protein